MIGPMLRFISETYHISSDETMTGWLHIKRALTDYGLDEDKAERLAIDLMSIAGERTKIHNEAITTAIDHTLSQTDFLRKENL